MTEHAHCHSRESGNLEEIVGWSGSVPGFPIRSGMTGEKLGMTDWEW